MTVQYAIQSFISVGLLATGLACGEVDVYAVTAAASAESEPSPTLPLPNTSPSPSAQPSAGPVAPASTLPPAEAEPSVTSPAVTSPSSPSPSQVPAVEPDPAPELCAASSVLPGDSNVTIQVGDASRSYVLHVPETYDGSKPVPLIVDFHGIGETGQGELTASPYPAVTDAEGVILAFPDGEQGPLGSAWNVGPCCVEGADDLAFARALVTDVQSSACIDEDRVYAVGVLTGGGLAYHLACHAADVFAAVAPAAFDLLQETVGDCTPSRPISVISFRGTEDSRVPYSGGPSSVVPGMPITFLGAEATWRRWAEINDCSGSPSAEDAHGCASYTNCANAVEVILCTDHGGREAHGAADVAWPVLRRHVR